MAFAIASGLTPQAGTLLRDCHRISDFRPLGGSKMQIGGPTGGRVCGRDCGHCRGARNRRVVHVYRNGRRAAGDHGAKHGLGTGVKFIPRPVVIGFTNGIAVLIASTQIRDFFGLHLEKVPGVFWLRVEALAGNFHTLSFEATALAVFTLLTLIICRGLSSRIPGPIVALLLSTSAVYFFKLPVETIGTRVWGNPYRAAALAYSHFLHGSDPRTVGAGVYGRAMLGGDRVTDVGGGCGPDE